MLNKIQARHLFLIPVLVITPLIPVIVLLFPTIYANLVHGVAPGTMFVYAPSSVYKMYAAGLILLVLSMGLLAFPWKRKRVWSAVFAGVLGLALFISAMQMYTRIETGSILIKNNPFTKPAVYAWDELESAVYRNVDRYDDRLPQYELAFHNGEQLVIQENQIVREWYHMMIEKIRSTGAPLEYGYFD